LQAASRRLKHTSAGNKDNPVFNVASEVRLSKIGSVTVPMFHCVFNADGSITHWATTYERSLYDALPHLYLVCVADNRVRPRRIIGAFMIKTSRHHDDPDFGDVVSIAKNYMAALQPLIHEQTSFLPARIGIAGEPPEEVEFLKLAMQQYTKFSANGSA
jgi:hypothetical protein